MNKVVGYQHVVVGCEVAGVADTDKFKESPIGAHDVVTSRPDDGSIPILPPGLPVGECSTLLEVVKHVFEAICGNDLCHLAVAEGSKVEEVNVKVAE